MVARKRYVTVRGEGTNYDLYVRVGKKESFLKSERDRSSARRVSYGKAVELANSFRIERGASRFVNNLEDSSWNPNFRRRI